MGGDSMNFTSSSWRNTVGCAERACVGMPQKFTPSNFVIPAMPLPRENVGFDVEGIMCISAQILELISAGTPQQFTPSKLPCMITKRAENWLLCERYKWYFMERSAMPCHAMPYGITEACSSSKQLDLAKISCGSSWDGKMANVRWGSFAPWSVPS